jgi:hypothetical protein
MSIFQLCYISRSTKALTTSDLTGLLRKWRSKNQQLDVTGLLIYDNGVIIQLLEGPLPAVIDLFSAVSRDPRHSDAKILFQTTEDERMFPEWPMGFCDPRSELLKRLPGYAQFFPQGSSLEDFQRGSTARLFFFQLRDHTWKSQVERHPLNVFSMVQV